MMDTDEEPPSKRMKTLGSKGLIEESDGKIGKRLEEQSKLPLHSNVVKMFLEDWDNSIATLQWIGLQNEKAVRFFLLEQKFFAFLKLEKHTEAFEVLRKEMVPLGVNMKRVHELASKLILDSRKDMELVNPEIVEKLQTLFPSSLIVPKKRLEYLVQKALDYPLFQCPNCDLLLFSDHQCEMYKVPSETLQTLEKHTDEVWFLKFSNDGKYLASSSKDKSAIIWEIERAFDYQLYHCNCHTLPNFEMSLFSDHHCGMYTGPSETLQTLEKHTDEVWFLKFSYDGKYLASSSKDKSAIIWEIDAEGKFSEKHILLGHEKPVVMVLWIPDDEHVITCGENEVIKRWNVDSGECVGTYGKDSVGSVSCGWPHDSLGIFCGMTDKRVCFWKLDETKLEYEKGPWEPEPYDIAITTDAKLLVSLGRLCVISYLKSETKTVKVISEEDTITSFWLSKSHKRSRFIIRSCFGGYEDSFIASGNEDSLLYIWSILRARKEPCCVLRGHSGAVNCVSWNPTDLHMLASASDKMKYTVEQSFLRSSCDLLVRTYNLGQRRNHPMPRLPEDLQFDADAEFGGSDSGSGTGSGSDSGSGAGSDGSEGSGGSGGSDTSSSSDEEEDDCTAACVYIQVTVSEWFKVGRNAANHSETANEEIANIPSTVFTEFSQGWNLGNNSEPGVILEFESVLEATGLAGYISGLILESLHDNTPKLIERSQYNSLVAAWKYAGILCGRYMLEEYEYQTHLTIDNMWDFFTFRKFQ